MIEPRRRRQTHFRGSPSDIWELESHGICLEFSDFGFVEEGELKR